MGSAPRADRGGQRINLSQICRQHRENTRRIRAGALGDRQNNRRMDRGRANPPTTDSDPTMLSGFTERRKSERIAVRTPAKIMLPHSDAPLDCVATNVSDGGAMIHTRAADLPDIFVLHFNDSGRQRHCSGGVAPGRRARRRLHGPRPGEFWPAHRQPLTSPPPGRP
jgi:hypothetical protein